MNYFEEEEYTDSKFDIAVWKKIFKMMAPFKHHLIIGLIAAAFLALTDTIYPQINRYAIVLAENGDISKLPVFIAIYLVVVLFIGAMVFVFFQFVTPPQSKENWHTHYVKKHLRNYKNYHSHITIKHQ